MSTSHLSAQVGTTAMVAWFRRFAEDVTARADELSALDAAIGDADHGTNLRRGCHAALHQLEAEPPHDVAAFGRTVGMQLIANVGGASGVLYGSFFLAFGTHGGATAQLAPAELAAAWRAGVNSIVTRGKAELGDKTMLDALLPAVHTLERTVEEHASLVDALAAAVAASEEGMRSTIPLVARKGRASYLGDRSVGHQDPGATSSWLLVRAAAQAFAA